MDDIVVSVDIHASSFLVTARASSVLNAARAAVMVSQCLAKLPAPLTRPAGAQAKPDTTPTPANQGA